jgi:hypothetical protein
MAGAITPAYTPGTILLPIPGAIPMDELSVHTNMLLPVNAGWHHGQWPRERVFSQHFLVTFGDAYYDPSYGRKFDGIASGAARLELTNFIVFGVVCPLWIPSVNVGGNLVTIGSLLASQIQNIDRYVNVFLHSASATIPRNEWLTIE